MGPQWLNSSVCGKMAILKIFFKRFFWPPSKSSHICLIFIRFFFFLSDISSREGRKAFSRKFMESFPPKKYWILLHIAFQFPIWCRKEDFFLSCQLQIDDKWHLTILKSLQQLFIEILVQEVESNRIQFLKIWLQHVVGVESNE